MALEPPSNTDLPWMVVAELGEWIDFSVKMESIEKTKNDAGWSCYMAEMKEIDMAEVSKDSYEVPFWAMESFFDTLNGGPEKGWVQLQYKRSKKGDKNTATFREA